ncbi:MAG: DivIVA domain-containing protein [Oscillospiraceae bacterium]|nr:DivIVA domain-containing protein [Oscillospiraceae bacterium]
MLTPQDLQEVSFEKAKLGGYVMKSVDEFLEPLMDDYVTLYKENAVLKSKMRLLVERLESYRANEATMKAAVEQTQKQCDEMLADARRRSDELVEKASREAKALDEEAVAAVETERLRRAKEATADFVQAVEAQIARQQQALEAIKSLDLPVREYTPKSGRRAYDYEAEKDEPRVRPEQPEPPKTENAEDIAAQIEKSVADITGEPSPRPKPDLNAPTRVMPVLDERTTAKFANLKFGKNYQP